jgi:hypothetical protein
MDLANHALFNERVRLLYVAQGEIAEIERDECGCIERKILLADLIQP